MHQGSAVSIEVDTADCRARDAQKEESAGGRENFLICRITSFTLCSQRNISL